MPQNPAAPESETAAPRPAVPRVRSYCHFRNRYTEYVSYSGMKWMSGGAKRQCDRALAALSPGDWIRVARPKSDSLSRRRSSSSRLLVLMSRCTKPCRQFRAVQTTGQLLYTVPNCAELR